MLFSLLLIPLNYYSSKQAKSDYHIVSYVGRVNSCVFVFDRDRQLLFLSFSTVKRNYCPETLLVMYVNFMLPIPGLPLVLVDAHPRPHFL